MKLIHPLLLFLHFAAVVFCFGAAIYQPQRCGLWPRAVFNADYPASPVAADLCFTTHDLGDVHSYKGELFADAFVFLVVGSVWWFLVGWVALRVIRAFATLGSGRSQE